MRCIVQDGWARVLHTIGGSVATSSFKDVAKGGWEDDYQGIKIAASEAGEVEKIKTVLSELGSKNQSAEQMILRWIKRVIFVDSQIRWGHFCNGTVFIWTRDGTPNDVLSSFLYRWAIEVCLYQRFKHVEVLVGSPRCARIALRAQVRLMKVLGCDASYIEQVESWLRRRGAKK